ncbi:acyltransferase [Nodularia harveyana UHCC-0300]|uniref:Acyltransferase n=1 Tax=Nodularia harveyana UHCC-0300 TaxID=2974287 RepID=A0ABU5UDF1_9CYAN|nr:acyltransferase [Nodularia harveyana]MEA5581398.1 acyltransferase [Nodularia harveyana UHCC-0300]
MIYLLIRKALNFNFLAQLRLNSAAKKTGMFVCRGKIQISICSDTIIQPFDEVCYVGIPLLGTSTPVNDTTVIVGGSHAILTLNGCTIGRGVTLTVGDSASLSIGSNSYINDGSRIAAQNSIMIGKNCAISFGVTIIDDDGHGFGLPPYSAPIVIEDNVWIGCNVTILKGVTIGKGSVVGAGAVVTKSCPPHSLIGGVPAKVIREGVNWTDKSRLEQSVI